MDWSEIIHSTFLEGVAEIDADLISLHGDGCWGLTKAVVQALRFFQTGRLFIFWNLPTI